MILPNTPAEVLANYIVNQGWAGWPEDVPTWNVSINKLPDVPDQNKGLPWLAVYDRKAVQDSVRMRTGERGEFWGWQILVRGKTDNDAYSKLSQIATGFDALYLAPIAITTSNYTIQRVKRNDQPTFLKQEERANMRIWTMEGTASIYLQGS